MRLLLVGFGNVGQGFAEILKAHTADLQLVGVATGTRGIVYHADGLDNDTVLTAYQSGSFANYPDNQADFTDTVDFITHAEADILVEASPTHLDTAQPAYDYMQAALKSGKHVVTANKGPIARHYPSLRQLAKDNGLHLRIESTVMAGTPAIATGLEGLAGSGLQEARGILNGTTNYILTQMESGMTYSDALAQAQKLGYAETDPTGDVEGWDAAGKVLILGAVLFGKQWQMSDLDVTGITDITPDAIQSAQAQGERYKLIASITADGGMVQPMRLPLSDPLAQVNGATNAITYRTDLLGDVTVIGAGAGRIETGYGLLSDILAIMRII